MFKDVAKSVARNTSVMFFQHIITTASSVLLLIFVPRHLGPVGYGRLYLAMSIAGIFQIFVNFGNNYLITKEVAREPLQTGQILVDAWALRSILATVSMGTMILFGVLMGYPAEVQILLVVNGMGLYAAGAYSSIYACFQGREAMGYTSIGAIAEKVLVSIAAIAAIMLGGRAITVATVIVLGVVLDVAIMTGYSRRLVTKLPRVNWKNAFRQIKDGMPYFLFSIFGVIYYRIDTVMLSKMAPEEVVGWYGGAYRLFDSFNFPYILTTAVYPVLSRLWKGDGDVHRRTTQKSLEIVILIGIPVSIAAIAFARPLIGIFYGLTAFAPSVILFQILLAGVLFLYVDMVLGTTLLSVDRQKPLVYVSLLAIPFNIGLNLMLIPFSQNAYGNGAIGAAAATGVTEFLIMLAALRLLPPGMFKGFRWITIGKSMAAGTVMGGVLFFCAAAGIPWVAAGAAAFAVYSSLLFAFRTFDTAERGFILGLMSWKGMRGLHATKEPVVNE